MKARPAGAEGRRTYGALALAHKFVEKLRALDADEVGACSSNYTRNETARAPYRSREQRLSQAESCRIQVDRTCGRVTT